MTTATQVREHIVRPTLQAIGLWSQAAENLVVGTAAHESDGFRYVHQVNGPALSWFQIEPATYLDMVANLMHRLPGITQFAIKGMKPQSSGDFYPPADYLMSNAAWACVFCRLKYWWAPTPLPAADDLMGLAGYWKRWYNTERGAGKPMQWLTRYQAECM